MTEDCQILESTPSRPGGQLTLHVLAGGIERHDHGVRFQAAVWPRVGQLGDHRPMLGDPNGFGW